MKNNITKIILSAILLIGLSCKNEPTKTEHRAIKLTAEDASCIEAWLRLEVWTKPSTVILQKGDSTIATLQLTTTDTLIVDEGLLPNQTYQYSAQLINPIPPVWLDDNLTSQVHVQTMDTTSHDFTWQIYTLGDGTGSSCLYDVAIINDTLAYAVGLLYQSGERYNVAKWDGESWQLLQFKYQGAAPEIKTVFAFNDNDIWFDPWFHWNGQVVQELTVDPVFIGVGVNKLWGTSSNDLYAVGNNGLIAHYNGSRWVRIESGTGLDVRDIWGAQNTITGEWEILATAGNPLISCERRILKITGNKVEALSDSGINWALNGIWFSPGKYYWIVGSGIWEKHPMLNIPEWKSYALTAYTIKTVRGNAINDVFMCGAYGEFLHFNGFSWRSYFAQTGIIGAYLALSVRNNFIIAVGEMSPRAVVLVGRR